MKWKLVYIRAGQQHFESKQNIDILHTSFLFFFFFWYHIKMNSGDVYFNEVENGKIILSSRSELQTQEYNWEVGTYSTLQF